MLGRVPQKQKCMRNFATVARDHVSLLEKQLSAVWPATVNACLPASGSNTRVAVAASTRMGATSLAAFRMAWRHGQTVIPVDANQPKRDLIRHLVRSKVGVVVTPDGQNTVVQESAAELGLPSFQVHPDKVSTGSLEDVTTGAKEDDAPVLHLYSDGDLDSANILPRPVVVSQKQLQIRVKSAVDLWQLKETDRVLSCLPAPHEAVVVDGTEAPLSVGGQICLPTSYGVWDLWKY